MSKPFTRYANAVKLHYLQYKESKEKENPTDYLKHLPSYFTPIPEYTSDSSMVFYDNEKEELIYAMRGLDFSSIKEQSPYVVAGGISAANVGGAVGNLVGGTRGRNRYSTTGTLIGAGIGSYLTGNKEVKSAMEIMTGGGKKEIDEETGKVNQMGEYTADLNKEIEKIRDIQENFPDMEIVLAGHSRGGLKANDLSTMMDIPAYLFNPATEYGDVLLKQVIPMVIGGDIDREIIQQFQAIPTDKIETVGENVLAFRTPDDLVSSKYSDKFNIEPNVNVEYTMTDSIIGRHSIDQFISDEMLKSVNQNKPINNEAEIKTEMLNNLSNSNSIPKPTLPTLPEFSSAGSIPFQKINPVYLCQSNPSLPFCETYL